MSSEQNKEMVRIFLERLDKDISAIEEFFSPDCAASLPGMPGPTDRDGFRQFVAMLYTAFPDLHHKVGMQVAEGDKVASIINVYGTHNGDFQGIAPTGRPVMFEDFMIARIQEGRVVELFAQFDALKLLQQLGVLQLPG